IYFSLAKRRKIKGKQETTARDGGNQAGLHPEMDFLGASAEHRATGWLIVVQERENEILLSAFSFFSHLRKYNLKRCRRLSCHNRRSYTSSKKYRTAPGLAETAGGADVRIEEAESAVRSEKPTDLDGIRDAKEKRFPPEGPSSHLSLSLSLSLTHSLQDRSRASRGRMARGRNAQPRAMLPSRDVNCLRCFLHNRRSGKWPDGRVVPADHHSENDVFPTTLILRVPS
ncbi:hypothetical protein ALC57_12265, partial [Trachymyrmex cornetzi]